jgi:hypothetical protein
VERGDSLLGAIGLSRHAHSAVVKFWQLMYVCRRAGQPDLPATKAADREEWSQFGEWWRHYDELIDAQDRERLDFELPHEYVREVSGDVRLALYESEDGVWLRHPRFAPTDRELSAFEAYIKYGSDAIDTALEKGTTRVRVQDC